jgi:hypothetical protein
MFFGLTNAPTTFQTMMNDIFHIEVLEGQVLIYLDDILIFDKDLDTHHDHVRKVLQWLRDNKLYLKPEKCEFDALETEYLGMIISEGSICMDPVKVQGIAEWPKLKSKRDVQSFIGFCNFYRRFVKDFAKIAKPLHSLTSDTPFKWTKEHWESFNNLKSLITSAPVLTIPNDIGKFHLECDSSEYAIGAILSQQQQDVWRPIAFLSKALQETQQNYQIYDKELLAIMMALYEFRKYLVNAKEVFEVWTDHANLQYFREPQKLNRCQARWLMELQDFHFTIHHLPGKSNTKADILSRRPGFDQGVNDNKDVVLLSSDLFLRPSWEINAHIFELPDADILPHIHRAAKNLDKSVAQAIERKEEGWVRIKDDVFTFRSRIYVPVHKALQEEIICSHHDSPLAGHPGHFKTTELILRNYWWPTLKKDVMAYVDGCEMCQRTKRHHIPKRTSLNPFDPPSQPWETITVDIIGPLPESQGYNAILTIVNWFSKAVKFEPITMELESTGFTRILRDRVF